MKFLFIDTFTGKTKDGREFCCVILYNTISHLCNRVFVPANKFQSYKEAFSIGDDLTQYVLFQPDYKSGNYKISLQ